MTQMSLLAKEMEGMASGLTSDKFLIQTMECDPNFQPKEKKEEFKNPDNNVRDTKLRVRLTYPRGVKPKTKGGSGSEGNV